MWVCGILQGAHKKTSVDTGSQILTYDSFIPGPPATSPLHKSLIANIPEVAHCEHAFSHAGCCAEADIELGS